MSIDITEDTFEIEVNQRSMEVPVMVDFWADWCQPCKALTPILEAYETEYDGRFVLAKVNTQTEQNLAQKFQISSIPNVKLIYKKEIMDEFLGALPQDGVSEFLEKNIPHPLINKLLDQGKSGQWVQAANTAIDKKVSGKDSYQIFWNASIETMGLSENKNDTTINKDFINVCLKNIPDYGSEYSDRKSILKNVIKEAEDDSVLQGIAEVLLTERSEKVLEKYFQDIVNANGIKLEEKKNRLFLLFQILGNDSLLTREYRKKLSRVLF